jgi:hypothetical protein
MLSRDRPIRKRSPTFSRIWDLTWEHLGSKYAITSVRALWTLTGYGSGKTVNVRSYPDGNKEMPISGQRSWSTFFFDFNRTVWVGFVADREAQGQVFLRVLQFFPVSIIPLTLHTRTSFIHHRRYIVFANERSLNKTPKENARARDVLLSVWELFGRYPHSNISEPIYNSEI